MTANITIHPRFIAGRRGSYRRLEEELFEMTMLEERYGSAEALLTEVGGLCCSLLRGCLGLVKQIRS